MNEVITIGVDLAKNVYQVHGVDAEGGVAATKAAPASARISKANMPWRNAMVVMVSR